MCRSIKANCKRLCQYFNFNNHKSLERKVIIVDSDIHFGKEAKLIEYDKKTKLGVVELASKKLSLKSNQFSKAA